MMTRTTRARRRRRPARTVAAAICAVLTLGLAAFPTAAQAASSPTVYGAGSTWVKNALDQWIADVSKQGLKISYNGIGSTGGRQQYWNNDVDFAASEIPFQPTEMGYINSSHRSYEYFPDVAGGTSLMYNLKDSQGKQVRDLKLSAPTIAGIFTGTITNWSDHHITADYGHQLPNLAIRPVIRSDGSGTSAQFSRYIAFTEPKMWAAFARKTNIPNKFTSLWPPFGVAIGQNGSDGVANYVANPGLGVGSIGYVEYSYAKQRGFPVASVKNKSGAYTQPTSNNVAVALNHAQFYKDNTQNLDKVYTAPEVNAYPISSYSYMISPTTDIDPAKGAVLGKFILYFACHGQTEASGLGYSPLPPTLVKNVWEAEDKIKGAPSPPKALNSSTCDNPTLGPGYHIITGGTNPTGSSQTGGGGTSTTSASTTDGSSVTTTGSASAAGTITTSATATTDVLPSGSVASLQALAAREIDGAKSGMPAAVIYLVILILALVFGPLFLRLHGGKNADDEPH
jgi:phosphate transport system substrate-binding protein